MRRTYGCKDSRHPRLAGLGWLVLFRNPWLGIPAGIGTAAVLNGLVQPFQNAEKARRPGQACVALGLLVAGAAAFWTFAL